MKRRDVNLLRSASRYLETRSRSAKIQGLRPTAALMHTYSVDLAAMADRLEAEGVDETPVSLDGIFGGNNENR